MYRSIGLPLTAVLCVSPPAFADVLSVGPSGAYAAPCEAFAAAADGDTIEIDSAGMYDGDVCPVVKNQLTIRGMGGLAKIDADGMDSGGKGIWVVQGDDTVVENIEFSGAAVPDLNGAGIRQEGKNLTVRGCLFHDNENGILGGDGADSEILIEHSEFDHNGAGDGYSHNLYIGHAGKLTFRYNWSHRSVIGHLLKSRAAENYVLYNRITGEDGSSSYELNFPNGGKTYVIGNLIEQGADTDNPSVLAYIEEGVNAANPSHQLYVVNNTFVNTRKSGTFLSLADGATPAVVANNVFFGGGTVTNQAGALLESNYEGIEPCLKDVAAFDYTLVEGSPCVEGGTDPGDGDGFALTPTEHYAHPAGNKGRATVMAIDIGAYELGGEVDPGGGGAGGNTAGGGAGQGPSGGKSGGSGTAGSTSGGVASPGGSSNVGGAGATSASEDDGGCGCRTSAPGKSGGWLLLSALGLVLLGRRRHGQ